MTSSAGEWDPGQYERFREERSLPFYDLLKLVVAKKSMRVVDLGCGTGELTREMHRTLRPSSTLGIDSSDAMLEKSREFVEPGLSFEKGDIAAVAGTFDLVFSNAALHWVPDHERVLAHLTSLLAPGGQLAIQMPANQDHPSHVVAEEIAQEAPFAAVLEGKGARQTVLRVEKYGELLFKLGYRTQNVRLQVYVHKLPSRDGVVEWVKGAMLTDFRKRMSDELYAQFLDVYRERLLARLDDAKPYPYTFKRVFVVGEK